MTLAETRHEAPAVPQMDAEEAKRARPRRIENIAKWTLPVVVLIATIWLWDRVQGGVGLSERLFEEHRDVLAAATEVVARCACRDGCPACIGPTPQAGLGGKQTARRILEHLAGGHAPRQVPVEEVEAQERAAAVAGAGGRAVSS